MVLDVDEVDENGDPIESREFSKVIDINLKGTMNSMFYTYLYFNFPTDTN